MPATNIDVSRLNGFFKDRFGENASALPSEGYDVLQGKIKFNTAAKLGEKITQPVRMQHSLGYTFAGGAVTGTMFALRDPNSPQTREATWTSQEFVIREQTSWKAMKAAQGSAQSFASHYDEMIKDMRNSSTYALEFSMLYGGSDLGAIEDVTGSGTTRTWRLSRTSSTAGLWYKLQGALMDALTAAGGTKRNTNADVEILSADIIDSADAALDGLITLSVQGDATDLSAVVAGDVLVMAGADGNQMVGIDAIAGNTGSYAGINATTYPLWRSTGLNAQAAGLTFSKLLKAKKRNMLKSGPGMRTVLVSEATATDLLDNISALQRMTNKDGGSFTLGGDGIEYSTFSGSMTIMPHCLVKEGEAFIAKLDCFDRIGSDDFSFNPQGNGNYFEPVYGFSGTEVIGYWDQSIRCTKPSSLTKISGIVNTF